MNAPAQEKLAYSVRELADAAGLSDQQIYNHITRGDISAKHSGTKKIILAAEARRFLETLPDEDEGPLS
jgi:predicted DNA-binding protein YlxM (UPF0122 family)